MGKALGIPGICVARTEHLDMSDFRKSAFEGIKIIYRKVG